MHSAKTVFLLSAGLLLAIAGCVDGTLCLNPPQTVESPSGPGSQTPNLAVGLDGELYLSWVEPEADSHVLRFATWVEDRWSAPVTVARGDDWFVNWADFPSMAALPDGTLAVHWLARSGDNTYAYDVLVSISDDGGENWRDPIRPHDDATQTEHGFVSLLPTDRGRFELVWLDGRNTPEGPMSLRYATLDRSGALGSEALVDARVCDCCSTDAVAGGDGTTLVAYRDRSVSEIRDISVSGTAKSGWTEPLTVHADNWRIEGCPVNGPALAAAGDSVAVAWFSGAENRSVVSVAFSRNGGRTFGRPIRIDQGDPLGRVDVVMLADGTAVASWVERVGDGARILLRPVRSRGALEAAIVADTSGSRSSGFPRMALHRDAIFLAWTDPGEPGRVHTAVLPL